MIDFNYKLKFFEMIKQNIASCKPLPTHFIIKNIEDTILGKLGEGICEQKLVIEFIGNELGTKSHTIPDDFGFPHYLTLPIECIYNTHL